MNYPYEDLLQHYPQIVQGLAQGLRRGQISGPTVVPHVGVSVRRWFINIDGIVVVETGWNNADSDFDYYQAS
jgi:hypothetical protein